MAGPVLWNVQSVADEGLMSLVTRTAARNLLPSAHVLLAQVGAGHANNPTAAALPGLDERLLAAILRQPLCEISRRRHGPRPEAGFVDFFGAAVRGDEIVFRRRRFAPLAIGSSPHARALWTLKIVPCCAETWQYLIDTCACGRIQRWQAADRLHRCDACNAPLAAAPATPVPESLREGLGFLVGLLDPDEAKRLLAREQLPPALAGWDGGMVFELALALSPSTEVGFRPDRGHEAKGDDLLAYTASLAQAADVIRGWPKSFVPLLTRRVGERALSRRNVRYSGIADHLPALNSDAMPPMVRAEIDCALAPITAAPAANPPGQIGMMQAAALLGQPLRILAPARREGRLITRIRLRCNRLMPTLDAAEIEHIHEFRRRRISAEKASSDYGLPSYAITMLADEHLLTLERHPFLVAHYHDPQLDRREHQRFRDSIRRCAMADEAAQNVASEGRVVPLQRVARAMGGGLNPWGAIFGRLRSGSIPFTITGDRVGCIGISVDDARKLLAVDISATRPSALPPTCSQRDALEILNLPLKHADLLRTLADADDDWEMDWSLVQRIARERITLTEMCARTNLNAVRLERLLDDERCPRNDRFGWHRDQALDALSRLARP